MLAILTNYIVFLHNPLMWLQRSPSFEGGEKKKKKSKPQSNNADSLALISLQQNTREDKTFLCLFLHKIKGYNQNLI